MVLVQWDLRLLDKSIQAVAGVFVRPVCDLCKDVGRFSAAETRDVMTALESSIARTKEETPPQAPQACRVVVVQLLQWHYLVCSMIARLRADGSGSMLKHVSSAGMD